MLKSKIRQGFTLAEVLITLGIIGVVAAMTIPTLMVDINAKQWSTAKDVFEKKLNESLKTMNTQQTISGHTTTLSFVEELSKHYKINKICQNDKLQDCFSETVYWGGGEATPEAVDMTTIKQASDFGLEDWGTELIGVQFANGVSGLVAYNPACSGDPYSNQFNGTGCISMLYDTSGNKNPNTNGKDINNFGVINRLGSAGCAIYLGGICFTAPFSAEGHKWNACQSNGTSSDPEDMKIMSDYGIDSCFDSSREMEPFDKDYWAGAMIACGGKNNVPTKAQLEEIAKFVYNTNQVQSTNMTFDPDKSVELGLPSSSGYVIWSNQAIDNSRSYGLAFYLGGTSWGSNSKVYDNRLTICVK